MIVVTGASGFIGRATTYQFDTRGVSYTPYDGEITNFQQVSDAFTGATVVVHLASGEARGRDRALAWVDLEGTETVLQACQRHNVRRLITVSRINADPYSHFPLLRAKGIVEEMVRHSGVPYTILQSGVLFGRQDRFIGSILSNAYAPIVPLPNGGRSALQPLWVSDLVRCLFTVLQDKKWANKTVTIAGNERLSYAEIVHAVLRNAGRTRSIRSVKPLFAYSGNRLRSTFYKRPTMTRYTLDRIVMGEIVPLNTVLAQFGFRPLRLTDYLRRTRSLHLNHLAPIV